MKNLLYIYPFTHTVVIEDEKLLNRHFHVTPQIFLSQSNLFIPLSLFRQLLFSLIQIPKADVVLISFAGYHSFIPSILGHLFNKPVHIVLHGSEAAAFPSIRYGMLRKKWLKKIIQISVSYATTLIPVSKFLIESDIQNEDQLNPNHQGLKAFYPKLKFEYNVIYNGLNPSFWLLPENNEARESSLVLAIAQPHQFELKGIDVLIEAAHQLKDISFKVIALKGHSTEKSLPPNVEYLPFLSPEEVRDHFQKATIFLQISRWEGFGCALGEAMLCGCLPITSNVNMLPQIAGNKESVLSDLKADLLVEKILHSIECSRDHSRREFTRKHIIQHFHIKLREERLVNHLRSSIE